jgi:hypothetical protein
MSIAEPDQARALGVARDATFETDGAKRVWRTFGGADDGLLSRVKVAGTLEEAVLVEKSFP